ncbi:hypothetical protein SS50377_26646 [Spironucleus salmonicida]|uniref:DUF4485 domain-containing protein n=1 Tax=Spironucleus salmonicida TaxID=348837 RepID=V6LCT6_9EUKA|nr:hypothetical protein SS50377_26646 [Spironucleus salmonicida]|eukprot:EST41491.1 Hypothetical protein SS50377_19218 [Spironucleus salmonicida]
MNNLSHEYIFSMIENLKPTEKIKARKWVQRLQTAQGKDVKITLKYFKLLTLQLEAIQTQRLKTLDQPFCYLPKIEALPDLPQLYFDRYQRKHQPECKLEKIDSRRCQRYDMQVLAHDLSPEVLFNSTSSLSQSSTQKQSTNHFSTQNIEQIAEDLDLIQLQEENYDISEEDYYSNTAILSSQHSGKLDELEYTFLSNTIQQLKFQ